MTDVLEEVTTSDITPAHVERRIGDWIARIESLYGQIEDWLPPEWRTERVRSGTMDEEMMRKFDITPKKVPVLELVNSEGHRASIEPRALWIVGANGRLDLRTGPKHYVIVDKAEIFAPPDWFIADFGDRRNSTRLHQAEFSKILSV